MAPGSGVHLRPGSGRVKNFLRVFKSGELDDDGVTPVWLWECDHYECLYRTVDHGAALFWVNAFRQANYHLKWHQERRPNAKI